LEVPVFCSMELMVGCLNPARLDASDGVSWRRVPDEFVAPATAAWDAVRESGAARDRSQSGDRYPPDRLAIAGLVTHGRVIPEPADESTTPAIGPPLPALPTQTPIPVGADLEGAGRNETGLERCDRNPVELLQEVRVVQTGVQVLFAFLLTAPLTLRFPELSPLQRLDYFLTLLAAGAAAVLLIAPTAYHRILFRLGDKEHLVNVANRFTLAGLACVAFSMVGAILLVTDLLYDGPLVASTSVLAAAACLLAWCVAPLRRRWRLRRRGP
jgi:hypothetical protein